MGVAAAGRRLLGGVDSSSPQLSSHSGGGSSISGSGGSTGGGFSAQPTASPLPYDADTERWLCPAYLLPDAAIVFHAMGLPALHPPPASAHVPSHVPSNARQHWQQQRRRRLNSQSAGGDAGPGAISGRQFGGAFTAASVVGDAEIGAVEGEEEAVPTASLSLTLQVNDSPLSAYHRPSNFSRTGFLTGPGWMVW